MTVTGQLDTADAHDAIARQVADHRDRAADIADLATERIHTRDTATRARLGLTTEEQQ